MKNDEFRRVEEELTPARDRSANLYDHAPGGVAFADRAGVLVDVNPGMERLTGVPRSQLIGLRIAEIVPEPARPLVQENFSTLVESGRLDVEVPVQRPDGPVRWAILNAVSVGPDQFMGYFTDITERKAAERALSTSEARMKLALHAAKMGVWEADFELYECFLSEESLTLLGLPPGENRLPMRVTADLVYPEDRERLNGHIKEILHLTGGPGLFDCIYRIVLPDGQRRWVHSIGQARLRGGERRPVYSGIILDVTEQKRAEDRLAVERKRLRNILDGIYGYVGLISLDGILLEANEAPLIRGGVRREDVIGRYCWETPWWCYSPDVQERLQQALARAANGEVVRYDEDVRMTGDELITIDVHFSPLLDEQGNITRVLGFAVDVTERNQAKRALREALAEVSLLKQHLEAENLHLRERIQAVRSRVSIIGQSAALQQVLGHARSVSETDSNVLILGETGTGKELLAEAIHDWSGRRKGPFVRIACAAIPPTLLESELFGREKGAFTGALSRQVGRFEAAEGGTLFLDEIGELPTETQVKLLRVLEARQFERLGSSKTIQADVRIIAATNRDLEQAIRNGFFREDLFHRLNVFPLTMPPLRQRTEDIPELVWSFVEDFSLRMGKPVPMISPELMNAIQLHPWTGNVRELRNAIERAMILSQGRELHIELTKAVSPPPLEGATLHEVERAHIIRTLESVGWRIRGENGAAKRLGLKPTTLESRMSRLGIDRPHQV